MVLNQHNTQVFLGRPRILGWHKQHLVHLVPAVHLSHIGFLCTAEQARDMPLLYDCAAWVRDQVSLGTG